MENEYFAQWPWLVPIAKAVGALIITLISGGGLYKFFDSILKARDSRNAREMSQEDLLRTQMQARIESLEAQIIPLSQQAAQLGPCQKRLEELAREREEYKLKYDAADFENRNLKTSLMGYDFIKSSPKLLRQMADEIDAKNANLTLPLSPPETGSPNENV